MRRPGCAGAAVEATMSMQRHEERIAQLLANAEVQRLAAELAIYEAREQLAPLRSAAGVLGVTARALAPSVATGRVIEAAARFVVGHPWLGSALAAGAMRLLRRRPLALLLAGATAAAAWWLLRPEPRPADKMERPG